MQQFALFYGLGEGPYGQIMPVKSWIFVALSRIGKSFARRAMQIRVPIGLA